MLRNDGEVAVSVRHPGYKPDAIRVLREVDSLQGGADEAYVRGGISGAAIQNSNREMRCKGGVGVT